MHSGSFHRCAIPILGKPLPHRFPNLSSKQSLFLLQALEKMELFRQLLAFKAGLEAEAGRLRVAAAESETPRPSPSPRPTPPPRPPPPH